MATENSDVNFGAVGTVNAVLANASISSGRGGNIAIGTSGGTAAMTSVAGKFSTINAFCVGAISDAEAVNFGASDLGVSYHGGGTGKVVANNSTISASEEVAIGDAQGNGTVIISGPQSKVQRGNLFLAVGDDGIGLFSLSSGASLNTPSPTYIGGSGGNGALLLSGVGTNWITPAVTPGSSKVTRVIDIGTDGLANGTGLLQLDHYATLTLGASTNQQGLAVPRSINLSTLGTLKILSGARVYAGSINETPTSIMEMGLDSENPSDNAQLDLSATANFSGELDLVLENNFQPAAGNEFRIFNFGNETGVFQTINLPTGYVWDLSDLYFGGIITAVPETSHLVYLLLPLVALRRRPRPSAAVCEI